MDKTHSCSVAQLANCPLALSFMISFFGPSFHSVSSCLHSCCHMFGYQFGLKAAYGVRISENALRIVLCLIVLAARLSVTTNVPSPEADQLVEPSPPTFPSATKPLVC